MATKRNRGHAREAAPQTRTLSAFLEDNFRLVSVFGVLLAVSTFAGNLALRAIGIGLSFLFLAAAMLVWVELWRKLPWRGAHWVLFLFRSTLTLITCIIILYWFVFFRGYMGTILPVVLTLVLVLVIAQAAKRAGLWERALGGGAGAGRLDRQALRLAGMLVAVVVSIAVAVTASRVLAPPLSRLLGALNDLLLTAGH